MAMFLITKVTDTRQRPALPARLQSTVSLVAQMVKNLSAMWEMGVRSLGWGDPLVKRMATHTPVFLPGVLHEQRSLVESQRLGQD